MIKSTQVAAWIALAFTGLSVYWSTYTPISPWICVGCSLLTAILFSVDFAESELIQSTGRLEKQMASVDANFVKVQRTILERIEKSEKDIFELQTAKVELGKLMNAISDVQMLKDKIRGFEVQEQLNQPISTF